MSAIVLAPRTDVKKLNKLVLNCRHANDAIEKIKQSEVYEFLLNKSDVVVFNWVKKMGWNSKNKYNPNDVEIAAYIVRLHNTEYFNIAILYVKKRYFYWARIVSEYLEAVNRIND